MPRPKKFQFFALNASRAALEALATRNPDHVDVEGLGKSLDSLFKRLAVQRHSISQIVEALRKANPDLSMGFIETAVRDIMAHLLGPEGDVANAPSGPREGLPSERAVNANTGAAAPMPKTGVPEKFGPPSAAGLAETADRATQPRETRTADEKQETSQSTSSSPPTSDSRTSSKQASATAPQPNRGPLGATTPAVTHPSTKMVEVDKPPLPTARHDSQLSHREMASKPQASPRPNPPASADDYRSEMPGGGGADGQTPQRGVVGRSSGWSDSPTKHPGGRRSGQIRRDTKPHRWAPRISDDCVIRELSEGNRPERLC